jgi:hypothetical protein
MAKSFYSFIYILIAVFTLSSSNPYDPEPRIQTPQQTEGWEPIFGNTTTAMTIKSGPPRDIGKGGKIYIKNDTLYQVETGKGIHVINISQPSTPKKIKFKEVVGCQEMSIVDHYLYTNNLNDLVVIDIQDIINVTELDRVTNSFHLIDQYQPPGTGWYECPNAAKGDIIGWEIKTIYNPGCRK